MRWLWLAVIPWAAYVILLLLLLCSGRDDRHES
jgi:hypothetical protein